MARMIKAEGSNDIEEEGRPLLQQCASQRLSKVHVRPVIACRCNCEL